MLQSARRVLEVVVPLVYRPALKAAFLDLGTAGVTAKVSPSLVYINQSAVGLITPAIVHDR